jgi:prepilin-type N-terminal cleavage/methylation domain-containing protein
MKAMKSLRRAFTLVEIMIVVLIIGILLAIAVPNFIKAREASRTKSCVANLKQIDSGKEQYAMDKKKNAGDPVGIGDVVPDYVKTSPQCPSTGTVYAPAGVSTPPPCPNRPANTPLTSPFGDHKLPETL